MSAVEINTIEEIEESGQWWWWAEQKRSPRLDYLRKAVWKKGAKGSGYQPGIEVDDIAEDYRQGCFTRQAEVLHQRRHELGKDPDDGRVPQDCDGGVDRGHDEHQLEKGPDTVPCANYCRAAE